ncbi:MAG: hypothetical protein ING69_10540 [Rhodocyclaceae bacterium]|nr:hypothetical protein [Rhodocyclaceae bacterium]
MRAIATAFAAAVLIAAPALAQTRIPGAAIVEAYPAVADFKAPLPAADAALFSGPLPLNGFRETDVAKIAPVENWRSYVNYRMTFFWSNKSDGIMAFAPVRDAGEDCHARIAIADQIAFDGRPLRYAPANIATQKTNLKAGDYKVEMTLACRRLSEAIFANTTVDIYVDRTGGHTRKIEPTEISAEPTSEAQISSARVLRFGAGAAAKPALAEGVESGFAVEFRKMTSSNVDDELKKTAVATRMLAANDIVIKRAPEMASVARPLLLLTSNVTVSDKQLGRTAVAIVGILPTHANYSRCSSSAWVVGKQFQNLAETPNSNLYAGANLIGVYEAEFAQPGAYEIKILVACDGLQNLADAVIRPMLKRPGEKRLRAAEPTDFVIKKGI